MKSLRIATLAAAIGLSSITAMASPQADVAASPPTETINHITVVNGGVGLDESLAVKRLAPQYSLRVVFSGRGGDYQVADRLSISQGGTQVLSLTDAGPWLLVDLPPGRYLLQGEFDGQSLSRPVTVSAAGTTLHWVLPPSLQ